TLGFCLTRDEKEDVNKGLEYLDLSINLDANFEAPKQNLVEAVIRHKVTERYQRALEFSEELLGKNKQNLDYLAAHIYMLNLDGKLKDAKKLIESYDNSKEEFSNNENIIAIVSETYWRLKEFQIAESWVDLGLSNFPESINLNRLKGHILMN